MEGPRVLGHSERLPDCGAPKRRPVEVTPTSYLELINAFKGPDESEPIKRTRITCPEWNKDGQRKTPVSLQSPLVHSCF